MNFPGCILALLTFAFFLGMQGSAYAQTPPMVKELEVADPSLSMRSGLIPLLTNIDSDFVFKQGPDVDGLPMYSATDRYNTSVEIIGTDNDIKIAKWTATFTSNRDVNIKEVFRMASFVQLMVNQEAVQWFSDQFKNNIKDHPLDDYTETKEFIKGRKIRFDYNPRLRKTSMTVIRSI